MSLEITMKVECAPGIVAMVTSHHFGVPFPVGQNAVNVATPPVRAAANPSTSSGRDSSGHSSGQ